MHIFISTSSGRTFFAPRDHGRRRSTTHQTYLLLLFLAQCELRFHNTDYPSDSMCQYVRSEGAADYVPHRGHQSAWFDDLAHRRGGVTKTV